jgi:putative ABC transport system substrate-binding protein
MQTRGSCLARAGSGFALAVLVMLSAGPAAWGASIGLVVPKGTIGGDQIRGQLVASLQRAGVASDGVEFLVQQPANDSISLANGIRKLTAYDVDMLVVVGGSAAREAMRQGVKIPVLFLGSYDPVDQGLVRDLKTPGKNLTGVSKRTSLVLLLDSIQETAAPRSIAVLVNPDNADGASQLKDVQAVASSKGIAVTVVDTSRIDAAAVGERVGTAPFIYLASGCLSDAVSLAELGRLSRPMATQTPDLTGSGIVFALAAPMDVIVEEGGALLARLVKGEKPSGIAVVPVRKIEFTVNMSEAARLGLKIPFPVVSRATKVIK